MGHSMESSRPIMAPSVSDYLPLLLALELRTHLVNNHILQLLEKDQTFIGSSRLKLT